MTSGEALAGGPLEDATGTATLRGTGCPKVHAVVVHHRGADLVTRAVRSLLTSDGVQLEVVVVWNAGGEPVPDELRGEDGVHILVLERAVGFSAANNRAVDWARRRLGRPDWYYFINNDTISSAPALKRLIAAARGWSGCGIVGPRLMIAGVDDHLNSLGLRVTTIGEAWDEGIGRPLADFSPLPDCRQVVAVTGSALLARADVLDAVDGWSEIYGYYYEDIDLCLRAQAAGFAVINVPTAIVEHVISATSDDQADFKRFHSWRNRFVVIIAHWPAGLLLAILPRILAAELVTFARRLSIGERADARLQARSWWGALRLLPSALRARRRPRSRADWTGLLAPAGSVPEITLPPADVALGANGAVAHSRRPTARGRR